MFFNPGNVSNSGSGGTGGGINIADIMPIISPLLSDATFDVISNKIIFTKRNGETFELDLSSLKGLTREEINSIIINLEEDLDNLKSEIEGKATDLKMESENLQLTSANGTVLSEVSFAATNNAIKELDKKIKEIDANTLKYKVIED